jgi:hypothetical protein
LKATEHDKYENTAGKVLLRLFMGSMVIHITAHVTLPLVERIHDHHNIK